MHGFWIFWVVALVIWATRQRRFGRRWVMVGPGWHPGAYVLHDGGPAPIAATRRTRGEREASEARDAEVDALESRIAELEQRLDFTERLLAERPKGAPPPS
jgi:hypothetical protein